MFASVEDFDSRNLATVTAAGYVFVAGSILSGAALLSFVIVISGKGEWKTEKILIPENSRWRWSVVFALLSVFPMVLLLLMPLKNSGYAPHAFGYNFTFRIPLLILQILSGAFSLTCFFVIPDNERKDWYLWHRMVPVVIGLPWAIQIIWVLVFHLLANSGVI